MKGIVIYVKFERYIREWLLYRLGSPVRFPNGSFENELIHRNLSKRPKDTPPDLPEEGAVPIVVTDCMHRRPEFYNYLGIRGRRMIRSAVDGLFRLHLWTECAPLLHSHGALNRGIDAWCERNGISLDAREAVRQKFYRMRRRYAEKGVVLGKNYRKKFHPRV